MNWRKRAKARPPVHRSRLDASGHQGEAELLPVDLDHLQELIDLELVEMRDEVPVLTNEGHRVLDE